MPRLMLMPFLLISASLFGRSNRDAPLQKRISTVEQKVLSIDSLRGKIDQVSEKLNYQSEIYSQINSGIENQLNTANLWLVIFTIALTVGLIVIGILVNNAEKKVSKIRDDTEGLLRQTKNEKSEVESLLIQSKAIKKDVEDLNRHIQNDIAGLYQKLRKEETKFIIDRILEVPEDIANVASILATRELEDEDFPRLKETYYKHIEIDPDGGEYYKMLFLQHYYKLVLEDSSLRKDLASFIPYYLPGAFRRDLIKTLKDLIAVAKKTQISRYSHEISIFYEAIQYSRHRLFPDIHKIIFDELETKQMRFEFYQQIVLTPNSILQKLKFGQLLKIAYANEALTQNQKSILEDVEILEKKRLLIVKQALSFGISEADLTNIDGLDGIKEIMGTIGNI